MASNSEHVASESAEGQRPHRVIVLGASNLSLAWPRIMKLLVQHWPDQLDVYTAHGMGSSYCTAQSGLAIWKIPGILVSDLWAALEVAEPCQAPQYALITDLGNDLVYGRPPEEVTAAAEECIRRIRSFNSETKIVMTRPPVNSVEDVGGIRYSVCRRLLFAGCPLNLAEVKEVTHELDGQLRQLAESLSIPIVEPDRRWYGLDPIHVRRGLQRTAFQQVMQHWGVKPDDETTVPKAATKRPRPAAYHTFSRPTKNAQPSIQRDGVRVFAY